MAESPLSKRGRLFWAGLLVAACVVVYANGITGAFTYDDKAIVRDNPRIRSPRQIDQVFATPYFGGPRGTGSAYRPLLLLSYAVQWWLHGQDVVAFHAVNILIHISVTLLFVSLLLRIGLAPPRAFVASLLFAVHPIHVEVVTSLVGRGETLAALFLFLYLHAALRLLRGAGFSTLLIALLCYAAAVLTKESGAVAPALAFLIFAFLGDGGIGSRLWSALRRGLPLYVASAVVLALLFRLRSWVLGGSLRSSSGFFEVENPLAPLPAAVRMANACVSLLRYLGRCLFPLRLSGDESAWSIRPLPATSLPVAAAVLLILLLVLFSLARLRDRSAFALGFLLFGVAMLPTGNLLFPIGTIFAERIAYLPSAGICLILAALLSGEAATGSAVPHWRRMTILAVALLFSARTIVRNAVWWTDEGLFANLASTSPVSAKAHYDVAYLAAGQKRYRKARQEYARAIAIYDGYWDAWAGKGRVEKEMGLLTQAEHSYEKSIAVHSGYENGYFGLGLVREARGNDAGAEDAYRRGLAQVPESLPLAYRLALVSARMGRSDAAVRWNRALELGGKLCSVRSDYARWFLTRGRGAEAQMEARQALRNDPTCAEALRLLAERAQQSGRRLARALALEKAYRASKSSGDLALLESIAREDPTYARRFAALRPGKTGR